ncbi:MAG: prepilin-type N-terminal cleavage/methylation domain-containing protein [Lachnospiraceae bacterium]|nr:prepilin-type N-terminal cleavage/methylation domain-containing protein [Lachnospiraceae bacterium]
MKLLNKKQKNNKGFSLVELIVVIAIMVVLVAVLAPVFSKYIESSRRSTDVQNANSIAESVVADVADGQKFSGATKVVSGTPSAIKDNIQTKGDAVGSKKDFYFEYDANTNKAIVYVDGAKGSQTNGVWSGDLTNEDNAKNYKDAKAGEFPAAAQAQTNP